MTENISIHEDYIVIGPVQKSGILQILIGPALLSALAICLFYFVMPIELRELLKPINDLYIYIAFTLIFIVSTLILFWLKARKEKGILTKIDGKGILTISNYYFKKKDVYFIEWKQVKSIKISHSDGDGGITLTFPYNFYLMLYSGEQVNFNKLTNGEVQYQKALLIILRRFILQEFMPNLPIHDDTKKPFFNDIA
jgi:hypothetical protein